MGEGSVKKNSPTDPGAHELKDHDSTQPSAVLSRQLSVLVVDDDPEVSSMLEALLGASGYRVVCARSGFMAKEALAEEAFPIVIIDRGLADGDGMRLCTDIRQRNEPGYVYIILLTARDSKEDVVAGLLAGADDYWSKRISEAELIARLNTASRIVRLERSLREALRERTQTSSPEVSTVAQNRLQVVKRIGRDLEHALQTQRPLSVLMLDIDLFKAVNDRYGHVAGDELLRQLANRVRFALPHDQDWIARIGGEEFVVVLPGSDIKHASIIAERLRSVVSATPFHISGADVDTSISIGIGSIATLDADEELGAQALIDQADRFLYRSKLGGRNRVSAPPGRPAESADIQT